MQRKQQANQKRTKEMLAEGSQHDRTREFIVIDD